MPDRHAIYAMPQPRLTFPFTTISIIVSLLSCAAMFGFFYAWTVSTMWGLDTIDPAIAITAMQAMNASVRNVYFAMVFFGTPVVLLASVAVLHGSGERRAAITMAAAAVLYLAGVFALTAVVNVPMNEQLARTAVPAELGPAASIWNAYSASWQTANTVRLAISGVTLLLVVSALLATRRPKAAGS